MNPTDTPLHLFCSVFVLVFVAELPDKTAFATLLLATRNSPLAVFLGACGAFVVQSAVAVSFGSLLAMLPAAWVHRAAGALFIGFAVMMWRRHDDDDDDELANREAPFWKVVASSFVVIFLAEWGDLTQLATIALVARYGQPLLIFASATLALWAVTGISVLLGHHLKRILDPSLVQRLAAVLFLAVGIYILARG